MKEPEHSEVKSVKRKRSEDLVKILEEETYLDNIGKIIERDFFPDLEKLRAQTNYLDAVEKNDVQRLREIFSKYSGWNPPTERNDASPATFETPAERSSQEDVALRDGENTDLPSDEIVKEDDTSKGIKLSLDQYLSSHTSEDNNSFQEMIAEAEAKHKQKYCWLYEVEELSEKKVKESLKVPSIEEQAAGSERPLNVDTWNYKNKNYIMYVPDGKELTASEKVELARCRQEISHGNSRFLSPPFDENLNKETIQGLASNQARTLEGKIGVDGKELSSSSTPSVNGYNFVKTPSPAPGVSESPLMTWGNIEGTPFRLDGGDTPLRGTPGPSFKIPEPPKREKLALALAEKAGQRHRDQKKKALQAAQRHLSSPSFSPNSGLDRLNSMSPAARNLASAQLRRVGSDRALQASYSPMVKSVLSSPSFTPKSVRSSSTPQRVRTPSNTQNLTDNLLQLNLPKRPKASDFF